MGKDKFSLATSVLRSVLLSLTATAKSLTG